MSAHSVLPPSGASTWVLCPLWVTMNRAFPQPDTPDTLGGHAAHWAAWERLAGRPLEEGMRAPNGVYITDEMIDCADLVLEVVRQRLPAGVQLHVEEAVAIARVHPECWGTPDLWWFNPQTLTLDVVDLKFGHSFVDEYENMQGVCYIDGIFDKLVDERRWLAPGWMDQRITVNFTIIQPRCFYKGAPVRTWSTTAVDLRGLVNKLSHAAHVALMPNPAAVTNEGCDNCPGRHACPALQMGAYRDAEFASKSGPQQLPPAAASLELRMMERALERLQARVDGLREVVTAYGKQGIPTPYHKLEQGYGRQQWTMPVGQVLAVGQMFGVDLSKPGVKTPKQAIAAGVDESVIKAYSITPMGSVKLTPCNPSDARRVFGFTN